MSASLATVSYIGATILFILSLGGLSNPETSRRGNLYGMIGMAIAVLATVFGPQRHAGGHRRGSSARWSSAAAIGLYAARTVQMTQMPELVALHAQPRRPRGDARRLRELHRSGGVGRHDAAPRTTIHEIEMYLGMLIGAVTFSGSVIAFGKLSAQDQRQADAAAGAALAQPRRPARRDLLRLRVRARAQRSRTAMTPLIVMTVDRAALRRPHGDGDRRRRHAGRGVDAEQLLGLGGGGDRLHADERPADRHRRAGRLERRDPVLHHVPRDEPQLPQRDRRRLRHRRRRAGRRRRARSRRAR